jgi:hypothetical protein
MARPVLDEERAPHGARLHALHRRSAVGDRLDHAEIVEVAHLVVVLGVGDGRAQHLLDEPGGGARRVRQRGQRLADRLAADLVEDQARLAGGHAHESALAS